MDEGGEVIHCSKGVVCLEKMQVIGAVLVSVYSICEQILFDFCSFFII